MDRAELEAGIADGSSIAQLAARFGCSKATVRYWLRRYGLKTHHKSRQQSTPEAIAARAAGLKVALLDCAQHGRTQFVLDRAGVFRCRACRTDAVVRRRRRVKQALVSEAGGRCQLCGYDRYQGALAFHHIDPRTKTITIANRGATVALERLRAEARKCVLLCHNCHAEVEGGVTFVSLQ